MSARVRRPPDRALAQPVHRVLLNTLPKSGSVFLFRTLSAGLGLPQMHLGNAYSLVDQIALTQIARFAAGGFVSQNHLAPSPENLQLLDHFGCRVVLHIRDPRQAMVSWVHHLDRLCQDDDSEILLLFTPRPPRGYFTWDLARKLDWQIDNYLPQSVDWLGRWIALHDQCRLPVMLTTYEELCRDIGILCRRICDFSGIPRDAFHLVDLPKTIDNHFRLGDDGEWRRLCSPAQVERANALLPPELADRFGWVRADHPRYRPALVA